MRVVFRSAGPELEAAAEFTAFSAHIEPGSRIPAGDQFATTDAEHVWIAPDVLRALADADESWERGLQAMVAFAGTRGWLDDQGRIRAHLE